VSSKTDLQLVDDGWQSPGIDSLHEQVQERLRALRVVQIESAPSVHVWQSVLDWASERIGTLDEDRKRLAISIEVEHELCNLVTDERRQRAALERELARAAEVQHSFMPPPGACDFPGLALTSFYRAAATCAGDWWSAYPLPGHQVMFLIGDVTGHGVGPAMLTGVAKGAADVIARMTPVGELTPAAMLEELNVSMCNAGTDSLQMTCAAALIDPHAATVTFASAGHPLPYVVRQRYGDRSLSQLVAQGNPLGASFGTEYEENTMSLEYGDAIVWYTDGVLDAESERGDVFGDKRFRYHLRCAPGLEPAELRGVLEKALVEFMGKHAPADDITFVVAQLEEPPHG